MKKKTCSAAVFSLSILISTVAFSLFINLAFANFVPYPPAPNKDPPTLAVYTPKDGENYAVNTVNVSFTVAKPASWLYEGRTLYYWEGFPIIGTYSVAVCLDGKQAGALHFSDPRAENGIDNLTAFFSVTLKGLTRGGHSIKIDVMPTTFYNPYYPSHPPGGGASSYDMATVSVTAHFVVNAEPPRILILSPANRDYTSTDVPLDIQVDHQVSQVTYSLDGHNDTAIAGNATLTGLYYGVHFLTVHVVDAAGNMGDSERITFRVTKPEPFPAEWVAVPLILVVVVGLGLIVYFKKRGH